MTSFESLQHYYRPHELQEIGPAGRRVICDVVALCRSGWTDRLKINMRSARLLGTSLRTLGKCAPESWYVWDCDSDVCCIVLPVELLAGDPVL